MKTVSNEKKYAEQHGEMQEMLSWKPRPGHTRVRYSF